MGLDQREERGGLRVRHGSPALVSENAVLGTTHQDLLPYQQVVPHLDHEPAIDQGQFDEEYAYL